MVAGIGNLVAKSNSVSLSCDRSFLPRTVVENVMLFVCCEPRAKNQEEEEEEKEKEKGGGGGGGKHNNRIGACFLCVDYDVAPFGFGFGFFSFSRRFFEYKCLSKHTIYHSPSFLSSCVCVCMSGGTTQ